MRESPPHINTPIHRGVLEHPHRRKRLQAVSLPVFTQSPPDSKSGIHHKRSAQITRLFVHALKQEYVPALRHRRAGTHSILFGISHLETVAGNNQLSPVKHPTKKILLYPLHSEGLLIEESFPKCFQSKLSTSGLFPLLQSPSPSTYPYRK